MLLAALALTGTLTFAQQIPDPDPTVNALNQLVGQLAAFDSGACKDPSAPRHNTAATVGTAAAIGSVIGSMAAKNDRAKGAAIGAAVGSVAGFIYDRAKARQEAAASERPLPEPPEPPASTQP